MSEIKMPSTLDFPGNSITTTPAAPIDDRPKVRKIAQGKTRKRGLGRKFADVFLSEDVSDVKGYILRDVLVPAIKETIWDVASGALDMTLFGNRRYHGSSQPSYSRYYSGSNGRNKGRDSGYRDDGPKARPLTGVKDIILDDRGAAEEVLGNMIDYIKDYGAVSVADLYEMVGITGQFTDNAWGWFDLGTASVRRVREGYLLVLPKIQSLK